MLMDANIRLQICTHIIFSGTLFTMLSTKTLLIGKPGFLNNLLKHRTILRQIRKSDAILLDACTNINVLNSGDFSSVIPHTWNILPYDLHKIQSSYYFYNKLKITQTIYNSFLFIYDNLFLLTTILKINSFIYTLYTSEGYIRGF